MNLIDTSWELLNIWEAFNTVAPVDWTSDGSNTIGTFTFDGDDICITISRSLVFRKVVGRVDFSRNGEFKLVASSRNASKLFGIIYNAFREKFKQLKDIDSFVFSAKDDIERRMYIYNWLGTSIAKENSCFFYRNVQGTVWTFSLLSREAFDVTRLATDEY